MEEREAPGLRNVAALQLAGDGSPEAETALLAALTIPDELALRGVIEGLGRTRSEQARSAVQALSSRDGLVGETARGIARLLDYRLGVADIYEIQPEALRLLAVDAARATPIEVFQASEKEASDALAD